ncbi:peptidase domain-containing ABC transporter [Iodobacter sp.]|uniref:peptidase domain-containing ABC transporter n=1 Tax=Iodobacter sp. TaxID=1915058 RepID=UPI0025F5CC5C|nr:peptidase domain-containing ABC transporter [Iodobacter sp.]
MNILPFLKFWQKKYLPSILQTESAECGSACLAMIAHYWGYKIDMPSMRRHFSVSLKGASLRHLIPMSQVLGLQARPLKVDLTQLSKVKLPCILHWNMNHFVVLKQINSSTLIIHDPAVGIRKLGHAEVAKHFTGVVLEITPSSQFKIKEERVKFSFQSLMGRIDGIRRSFIQLVLLGLALQICTLLAPFYLQWIVDEALVSADRHLISVLGIGFLLLIVLQTAIGTLRSWVTNVMATNINFQWQGNAFSHLMRLPLAWFEKRHLGDIVSRFGSIHTIQRNLTTQLIEGVLDGVLVSATLILMLCYSVKLTAITLLAVLIYVLLRWAIFSAIQNATTEQIIHAAKQHTHFLESARSAQSIRLFDRQEERRIGWMNLLAEQFNADIKIARLSISFQSANTLLFGIERIVVIWVASFLVLDNYLSIGMLFAYISYKDQFSQRIAALIDKLFELKMLRVHGERLADILLTEPEPHMQLCEVDPEQIIAKIEFNNVSFRYADNEPYILKNINLTIPAGQCIAITGASGCGKTTLLKLLLGVVEPTEGDILINGMELKKIGLSNFRKTLGVVMQDDYLFSGSIADNISFFDPVLKQEQVEYSAKLSAIHGEIMQMPMAYHTLVGNIGSGISGGQKQRILLARALYKSPKLLVLDEATSHLDVKNEGLVNKAIQDIVMTRVLVAHRPETIASAERVIYLETGQITQDTMASSCINLAPVMAS